MTPRVRWLLAGLVGVVLTLALNRLGIWWLGASTLPSDAFYDGSCAFLTLAIPSFVAGLVIGLIAREQSLNVAAITFLLFCTLGFVHPFWRIPLVSARSAHSGGMHYFLYNPIVALAFAALGAWLMGQFVTGKWTLADEAPVSPPE